MRCSHNMRDYELVATRLPMVFPTHETHCRNINNVQRIIRIIRIHGLIYYTIA